MSIYYIYPLYAVGIFLMSQSIFNNFLISFLVAIATMPIIYFTNTQTGDSKDSNSKYFILFYGVIGLIGILIWIFKTILKI